MAEASGQGEKPPTKNNLPPSVSDWFELLARRKQLCWQGTVGMHGPQLPRFVPSVIAACCVFAAPTFPGLCHAAVA